MNKNIIYCFSGTGNSLNAAMEIAKNIKNTEIISMRCIPENVPSTNGNIIGFIFPVYHWTMPALARDFIERVQINSDAYIFGIASCGGLSVNALNDLSDLLKIKEAVVSYSAVHNNVANYIAAYEPFPNPTKKLPKAKKELDLIVKEISNMTYNHPPKKTVIKEFMRLIEKPFVKSLATKDKDFNISSSCTSCGLCSKLCIAHNIEMKEGKPVFKHNCTQCMGCIVYCPKDAINYKNITQKRTKYHHPDVRIKDLLRDHLFY